jgi:hypothetical protein
MTFTVMQVLIDYKAGNKLSIISSNKGTALSLFKKKIVSLTTKWLDKGNNKITELRTILQRESQNS